MINMNKWEEVEHEDVRVGDKLKIVEREQSKNLTIIETYRGKVTRVDGIDFYLSDGTCWENVDPTPGETVTVYRRKADPLTLPTKLFATIKGQRIGHPDVVVRLGRSHAGWVHESGTHYTDHEITTYFDNLEVLFEGIDG